MNVDDTLISKLIEETCTESIEKDQPNNSSDLRRYFEKRLNQVEFASLDDYLEQHQLGYYFLAFSLSTACYRLNFNHTVLDFPSNWSVFKEIKNTDVVFVDQSLDQDYLLDIFSELNGSLKNFALVKNCEKVQLIFLAPEESREHIKWIREYFEKKNMQVNNEQEMVA